MRSRLAWIIPLVLWLLPAGVAAQARTPRTPRKVVGAEVGYSRTTLGGPDASGLRSRQGALTGVFLQVPLNRLLSIRPEVLFALKGGRARATVNESGEIVPLDIELAYVEFPILLRAGTRGSRFRPLLFGGPAPAIQIGCDLQIVDPALPIRTTCDASVIAFSSFDLGLVAGGGLEMRFPRSSLSLEARYTTGMRSVLSGVDVRNRAFALVLALTF